MRVMVMVMVRVRCLCVSAISHHSHPTRRAGTVDVCAWVRGRVGAICNAGHPPCRVQAGYEVSPSQNFTHFFQQFGWGQVSSKISRNLAQPLRFQLSWRSFAKFPTF